MKRFCTQIEFENKTFIIIDYSQLSIISISSTLSLPSGDITLYSKMSDLIVSLF